MTRVLIADDHPIMRSGIEAILSDSPYEVVANVSDGNEALEAIERIQCDMLLLDVRMPGCSGMDLLRTLRNRGDRRPIVLLTADMRNDELVEAIQLEVSGILLKDGAQALLLRCMDEALRGGRWIDKTLLERAVDVALLPSNSAASALRTLPPREKAIVELVARGLRNREVASELGITEGTVKVYLYRIYEKLGVTNRTELALFARGDSIG